MTLGGFTTIEVSGTYRLGALSLGLLRRAVVGAAAGTSGFLAEAGAGGRVGTSGFLAEAGAGGRIGTSGFLAEAGAGGRDGAASSGASLCALCTGTTINSEALGLGLAAGTAAGGGAGAVSTTGAAGGAVGAAPLSEADSVCAITKLLPRTLRPPTKLNACISRGHR